MEKTRSHEELSSESPAEEASLLRYRIKLVVFNYSESTPKKPDNKLRFLFRVRGVFWWPSICSINVGVKADRENYI
ncbi:hypothetical protein Agabi119p4_11231 [Agaricus bisporus var. burnettii]|uniref:Uncharacterized protein n=1 Tax=Agaricus bisporus var. burnettii TaxID=192524 RepID=A0A8H7EWH4_AGABI|nr:hypothetical protein Agabi119p4_11231 [Agaricus bisporus var. burnettii]